MGSLQALVLAHTRELSVQIYNEFKRFSKYLSVRLYYCLGGQDIESQRKELESDRPNIIVGTPGRVMQLTLSHVIDIRRVQFFVIDECDKILQQMSMRAQVQ